MKIYEYQAHELLARYGVAVAQGVVASSPEEAERAFVELGGSRAVVKAQIHAGGRGKAGGIVPAESREEVVAAAGRLLGTALVTPQTGPMGEVVRTVLVQAAVEISREFYAGIVVDRRAGRPTMIVSAEGGVEIEELARRAPEKIVRVPMDPIIGPQPFETRKAAHALGLVGPEARTSYRTLEGLARAFYELDASLAEINPLVLTDTGDLLALDAKMVFDDNALPRHPEIAALRDTSDQTEEEALAAEHGLSYVAVGGNIGCMVNGAGLAMATMDLIRLHRGEPANFLDVGGGASVEQVTVGFRLLESNRLVKAILVNIFGGIMRCDVIAQGIIEAARQVQLRVPLVVRLEGTNVEEGRRLLRESDLHFIEAVDMDDAAVKAVAAAGKNSGD